MLGLGLVVGYSLAQFQIGSKGTRHAQPTTQASSSDRWLQQQRDRRMANPPASSAMDPNTLPPDEMQAVLESARLMELRTAGEFVLELEDPLARRLVQKDWDEIANEGAERRNAEGVSNFMASLGMTPEQVARLDRHLTKIQKASLEASTATIQLLTARDEYDKRLRASLSKEDYAAYRAFEENRHGRHELDRLRGFLDQSQLPPMADPLAETLAREITRSQAYTETSWYGPFDGLPQVGVGYEHVLQITESNLARMRQGWETLQSSLDPNTFPPGTWQAVQEYFEQRIQAKQARVEELTRMKARVEELGPVGYFESVQPNLRPSPVK